MGRFSALYSLNLQGQDSRKEQTGNGCPTALSYELKIAQKKHAEAE